MSVIKVSVNLLHKNFETLHILLAVEQEDIPLHLVVVSGKGEGQLTVHGLQPTHLFVVIDVGCIEEHRPAGMRKVEAGTGIVGNTGV